MTRKIVDRLPWVFVCVMVLACLGGYFLAGTPLRDPTRIAMYLVYASSVTVLAYGYVGMINRTHDGLAAVYLVCITYVEIFFAAALWVILTFVIMRTYFPAEPPRAYLDQMGYAVIAGGLREHRPGRHCLSGRCSRRIFGASHPAVALPLFAKTEARTEEAPRRRRLRAGATRGTISMDKENRDAMLWKLLATVPGGVCGSVLMWFLFDAVLVWFLYGLWFAIATVLFIWMYRHRGPDD